jgi:hypothetical protein
MATWPLNPHDRSVLSERLGRLRDIVLDENLYTEHNRSLLSGELLNDIRLRIEVLMNDVRAAGYLKMYQEAFSLLQVLLKSKTYQYFCKGKAL